MELSQKIKKYRQYFLDILWLSLPLILGNLGVTLIGATDVLVAAKHGIMTLAPISIANSIIFTIFIIGMGLMAAISIVLANYRGARRPTSQYFKVSIIYSMILATIFCLMTLATLPIIDKIGFEAELVPIIKDYIRISAYSFFGIYLYQGIKEFLQAHEIVDIPNYILFGAVFINLVLDFAFVFGFGPIKPMGAIGLAIATLLVRTLMGLTMLIYCQRLLFKKSNFSKLYIKQLLKTGYPIGISLMLEFLAFNIITILVGKESGFLAATHNMISLVASTTFMVPLAIANAISIKVGFYNGAKNYLEIKHYSFAGVFMATGFMVLSAIIITNYPAEIIGLFTNNQDVIKTAIPVIFIAGLFQIADGFQVSVGGILKGLKMTKTVAICMLSAYWGIGIPLGIILAYKYNYSLKGFWIGLAVSLFAVGIIQSIIYNFKMKQLKKEYCYEAISVGSGNSPVNSIH